MRELGSQSLRFICLHDMPILAPLAIEKSVSNSSFGDDKALERDYRSVFWNPLT